MKRRIIVILSLILCFMLSCDEETLDKVFVQGGMDASSPKVVVAVDPDRVEAFENGEVTSIKKESEVKSFETIKETPPVEVYSLTKEEVVLTLKEAVDSAKAEAEDDLKAYVDSLFSNEKTEIMEGVEKAKEDTILELKSIESSILSVVEENKNEILSNNEILESSFDEKSSVLEKEIESTNILLDSTIREMEEKIEDLYAYIDSEVPALIDEAKAEIMDEVNANIALLSSNTSSASYDEDIKEYVGSKCAEIEEEITSYIDQIEEDISSSILREVEYKLNDILNDEDTKKYTEVHNTPTINGVSIYNTKTHDLGIREISSDMLIDMLDDIWKNEIITNPLFPISHREVLATESQIILHKANPNAIGYELNDMFAVYASGISKQFFTLYLSKDANGKIDDTLSTVKIIPFINIGTYILLEKKYEGLWLHCTEPNTKSIKL